MDKIAAAGCILRHFYLELFKSCIFCSSPRISFTIFPLWRNIIIPEYKAIKINTQGVSPLKIKANGKNNTEAMEAKDTILNNKNTINQTITA